MRKIRRRKRKRFIPNESKLEKEVGAILKKLGYKHVKQSPMFSTRGRCRGIFDFYLTSHRVAIEVNGTYWHCDPRAYPDGPKYTIQKKNIASWKRKVKYAKQLGIQILVLWEIDLRNADDMYEFVRNTVKNFLDTR